MYSLITTSTTTTTYCLLVICNVNCRFDKFHHYMNMTRKTVLKLAMSSTFFTSNNTLSIRACVTSTEIIMYTFQFRKRLWVNMILDSGKSFSISNIKIHILEFCNYQVLFITLKIVEYIWCIHFLLNKCKTSIKTMVLSERFRFVMENKNEIKCRW